MKSKKAAMEMSVGTIVTIVLLMTVLVLGIFFIQRIFSGGVNAIDSIETEIQNQINKLFSDEGKKLVVYPTSRDIKVKKGDDPKGFGFNVENKDVASAEFSFGIRADDISDCGSLTEEQAENFLLPPSGEFSLGPGNHLENYRIVKLNVPETAPPCTIIYVLDISKDAVNYASADIFVTIK